MTKEELYLKYKFLIPKVIKDTNCRYRTKDEWQEYYDAGEIGLIRGINAFDFKKETTSYFYECIKREILVLFHYKTTNKRKINYIKFCSLDYLINEDIYLHELIADSFINIESYIIKKEQYENLYKAINMLKPSYKDLIYKYYGFINDRKTLDQLSKEYNISRQAISIKKKNAIKKLKYYFLKLGEKNE